MTKVTKFVTDEYHEGQMAYARGSALTANPYLSTNSSPGETSSNGAMWFWMFGWQDAMADEVRWLKAIMVAAASSLAEADKEMMN